jgi:hypothetical protein
MAPLIVVSVVVMVMAVSYARFVRAQKRRRARTALAETLGLRFDPDRDYALADRYRFLDKLRTAGGYRFAFNRFWGNYRGCQVTVFDYNYEMRDRSSSKGYDYYSCFVLRLPKLVPRLTIVREGLSSKIAQALGYEDIDFESHQFSRKFCVRSSDKRFAYDFCNTRMVEYLLGNDDLNIEVDEDALAIIFNHRLDLAQIEPNLKRLVTLRSLMPEYLFSRSMR